MTITRHGSHSLVPSLLLCCSSETHSGYTNEPCKSHTEKAEETTEMSCLQSLSELEVSESGTATVSDISTCCECSQIHTRLCAETGMSVTGGLHTDMKTKALFFNLSSLVKGVQLALSVRFQIFVFIAENPSPLSPLSSMTMLVSGSDGSKVVSRVSSL